MLTRPNGVRKDSSRLFTGEFADAVPENRIEVRPEVRWAVKRKIPEHLADAIVSLEPDVIALTEYGHGPSRAPFHASLANHGFQHLLISEQRRRENQVRLAAGTGADPCARNHSAGTVECTSCSLAP